MLGLNCELEANNFPQLSCSVLFCCKWLFAAIRIRDRAQSK